MSKDIKKKDRVRPITMLVLGGCRSGKSRFAETHATERYSRKIMIATLEIGEDLEMADRVAMHRKKRAKDWNVIEEPVYINQVIEKESAHSDVFLVDCLTLWITNLLIKDFPDKKIQNAVLKLIATLETSSVPVILVANEVGLGIVPDSPLARRFRDLAGWANQKLAAVCDTVIFMAAGIPLTLKQTSDK